jgi:hypothetical protein
MKTYIVEGVLVNNSKMMLYVNSDKDFKPTPKKGNLKLVVDNTQIAKLDPKSQPVNETEPSVCKKKPSFLEQLYCLFDRMISKTDRVDSTQENSRISA